MARHGTHQLRVRDALKRRVLRPVARHPLAKLLDVRNGVQDATRCQQVRVLVQHLLPVGSKYRRVQMRVWEVRRARTTARSSNTRHDAPSVVLGLEVWVGEADEDLGKLALLKVVWQILHAVGPHHRRVDELEPASAPTKCHAPDQREQGGEREGGGARAVALASFRSDSSRIARMRKRTYSLTLLRISMPMMRLSGRSRPISTVGEHPW